MHLTVPKAPSPPPPTSESAPSSEAIEVVAKCQATGRELILVPDVNVAEGASSGGVQGQIKELTVNAFHRDLRHMILHLAKDEGPAVVMAEHAYDMVKDVIGSAVDWFCVGIRPSGDVSVLLRKDRCPMPTKTFVVDCFTGFKMTKYAITIGNGRAFSSKFFVFFESWAQCCVTWAGPLKFRDPPVAEEDEEWTFEKISFSCRDLDKKQFISLCGDAAIRVRHKKGSPFDTALLAAKPFMDTLKQMEEKSVEAGVYWLKDRRFPDLFKDFNDLAELKVVYHDAGQGKEVSVPLLEWIEAGGYLERGLMVEGSTGCGKTQLVKALAGYIVFMWRTVDFRTDEPIPEEKQNFIFTTTLDVHKNYQSHFAEYVPIITDEFDPNDVNQRVSGSLNQLKNAVQVDNVSSSNSRHQNAVYFQNMPRLFTTNTQRDIWLPDGGSDQSALDRAAIMRKLAWCSIGDKIIFKEEAKEQLKQTRRNFLEKAKEKSKGFQGFMAR